MLKTGSSIVEEKASNVVPRTFDTYMAVIENAPGSEMFKNAYADVDGVKEDITDNGDLSCAFFVSSVLVIFGFIREVHITVASTVKDMENCGWFDTEDPKPGDVVVWGVEHSSDQKHKHIGFFLGDGRAVSNSKYERRLKDHSLEMAGRDIERILTSDRSRAK